LLSATQKLSVSILPRRSLNLSKVRVTQRPHFLPPWPQNMHSRKYHTSRLFLTRFSLTRRKAVFPNKRLLLFGFILWLLLWVCG